MKEEPTSRREEAFPRTAIVLAGGLGTRLREAVTDRPKVLAPAAGRPFLDYALTYLAAQGMQTVILSVGYRAEQVRAFAGEGSRWGLRVRYSEESAPLGTGGALRQASRALSGPFFALNGDTLFLADLQALWRLHNSLRAAATLALLPVSEVGPRGRVVLESGRILAFLEKPDPVEADRPALVNGGVYVLAPSALEDLAPGQPASLEEQVFPHLAGAGRLAGVVQDAYFADIGTPQSLAAFERDVYRGRVPGMERRMEPEQKIAAEFNAASRLLEQAAGQLTAPVAQAASLLAERLAAGSKLLVFGNGGSAAEAQHMAAELVGRFRRERRSLPALALTTDTSLLTAIGNDYGFDLVFSRQVQALAQAGDVVLAMTTSGRSPNILAGLQAARQNGAHTILLTGENGSPAELSASEQGSQSGAAPLQLAIRVPSKDTARIQEVHAVVVHILCELVEEALLETGGAAG